MIRMPILRTRSSKNPKEEKVKEKPGDSKGKAKPEAIVLLQRIDTDSTPMDRVIRTARRSDPSRRQGNAEVQGGESSHSSRSSSRRSEGESNTPLIGTRSSSRKRDGNRDLEVTGTRVSSRRIARKGESDSGVTGTKSGSKKRGDTTDKAVVNIRSSSRRREDVADKAVAGNRASSRRREDASNKAVAGTRSSSRKREDVTDKAGAGTRTSSRRREDTTNESVAGTRSSSRRKEGATNKAVAGPRSSSRRREDGTTDKAVSGTRSSSRRREETKKPPIVGSRSSSRRREMDHDPPVAGPSKVLARRRENKKPDDSTSTATIQQTTTRARKVERATAKEVVQKKSVRPRKKRNLGNAEESSSSLHQQEASSPAPSAEEPSLSANVAEVSLSQRSLGSSSASSLSTKSSSASTQNQNSQETTTSEPRATSSAASSVVTALPGIDLFPKPTDSRMVQKQKHKDLPRHLQHIISKVFNEIQDEDASMSRLYARVDKLYNCAEVYGCDFFVERYHATFVNNIWMMVTSVFKNSLPANKFVTQIWDFIEYCFVRLGWAVEIETGDRNKQRGVMMKRPKSEKHATAAYYAVKAFIKTYGDASQYSRLCQLKFLETLVSTAAEAGNTDFIKFVSDTVTTAVTIRLKDKSIQCRLKAISILSYFVRLGTVDSPESRDVIKEIKFYTRYDPSVEIRKLGTAVLAATTMKLRFFYDQAFDKSLSVRYEALKAFIVERDGELVRDMGQLNSEKLCKVVIWGMDFSDTRCSDLMTNKILLAWLKKSCNNNLTLFLSKLDAYEHMKAVMRILNVLLTEEVVETLDLNFINSTVDSILANDYKNVCIESMVGWLALCSIAQRVQSLAPKVIPDVTKILDVVKCLHKCALLESSAASDENRSEDITPVICLTLALQLTKFVTFEEGNRRHFVKLLQDMLLDPLLDEKPLVVQAVHTLHSYVPHDEYNDIIMSIFQDIFDPKSDNVHGNASRAHSMEEIKEGADVEMADEIEVNRGGGFEEEEVFQNSAAEEPLPQPEEVVRQPMTKYQLTKLREQLCDLKTHRLTLQSERDELLKEKRYLDSIPLTERIMKVQQQETEIDKELEEQEALLKNQNALPKVVQTNPQHVGTPTPSSYGLRASLAPPQCDEQNGSLIQDVDDEAEDEDEDNNNASCIINTVEQGLVKGLCMINAHMDLKRPGSVDAFVRNIYDNHLGNFLLESDISIHMNVLKFLTKMALADKRELRKVTRALIRTLGDFTDQTELKHIAYQSLVDLVVSYDYKDFILTDDEKLEEDHVHPYKHDFDRILKDYLGDAEITYENATVQDIQKMFTKLFSDKFQNEQRLSREEQNVLNTTKNQGLLKLMIRGRIRDPSVISMVLELWVNHEYIGTPVLRDLEHALKLFSTFRWWGKDATQGEDVGSNFQMRVLAESLTEATVHLSQERRSSIGDEHIEKFVTYILGFLDTKDEELMIHLTGLFLDTIALKPSRSYNDLIIKCAMLIPLKTHEAATRVVNSINEINESLKHHPHTNSVGNLKTAIKKFVAKIKRVFGNEVVENIRDSNSHSTSDPEDDGIFGDSDDDLGEMENQGNDEIEIQGSDEMEIQGSDEMEIQDNDVMEDPELKLLVSDSDD